MWTLRANKTYEDLIHLNTDNAGCAIELSIVWLLNNLAESIIDKYEDDPYIRKIDISVSRDHYLTNKENIESFVDYEIDVIINGEKTTYLLSKETRQVIKADHE